MTFFQAYLPHKTKLLHAYYTHFMGCWETRKLNVPLRRAMVYKDVLTFHVPRDKSNKPRLEIYQSALKLMRLTAILVAPTAKTEWPTVSHATPHELCALVSCLHSHLLLSCLSLSDCGRARFRRSSSN